MINKVTFIGKVVTQPTISAMQNGNRVANFLLTTSESWIDKNSQKQIKTETHKIVVYDERLVDFVEKFVKKDSNIFLDGMLKTRKQTTQDGVEKNVTEVVLQNYSHTIKLLGELDNEEEQSYNKSILIGNVGSDPDIRTMPNGNKVANFSLATSEYWLDKDFQRQSRTEWHKIVIFSENIIKLTEKAIHKGSKIYLEGIVRNRKYTSQHDGIERNVTEIFIQDYSHTIKLLDPKPRDSNGDLSSTNSDENNNEQLQTLNVDINDNGNNDSEDLIDDDIPF